MVRTLRDCRSNDLARTIVSLTDITYRSVIRLFVEVEVMEAPGLVVVCIYSSSRKVSKGCSQPL